MRKADYTTLARLIHEARQDNKAKQAQAFGMFALGLHAGALESLELLARGFASSASVDGPEFLRACGID